MITLDERRKIAQVSLVHNIRRDQTSSRYIQQCMNIRTLQHTLRETDFFTLPNRLKDYSKFEPVNYMLLTYNEFYKMKLKNGDDNLIDINISTDTIKERISNYFKTHRSTNTKN